ncbi:invasion associated locus B family protein [Cohaesibacter gelatinilyticus]|uniref:Invasion protein IalB, involved in pathogenesis n=1 Tax=Cohaesibacter gelatinilyticus TaxID=372072 RepID=A0A285NDV1_9HYPH|nr:invasion associated locus B family protein [Cohaesibacter gelatinilyticus]SNZ07635.1 Invasion protein IalB, involved in pathogenesis [Cohaesibacter gelatinilyticus]
MVMIDKASKLLRPFAFGALATILFAATAPAQAQTETKALEQAAKTWVKICSPDPKSKKNLCMIAQELRAETGQFLASVAVREIEGKKRKSVVIAITPGMLLQPGLSVQIDKGKQNKGAYGICFPNACYAEIVVDANYIAQMKKGSKLSLTTLNQQAQPVRFDMTLSGFTAAYDGPSLDPAKAVSEQEQLQSELRKRAEEQRKKLLEQKKKADGN